MNGCSNDASAERQEAAAVPEATDVRLLQGLIPHLRSMGLMMVGVVDVARERGMICKPEELGDKLAGGGVVPYRTLISEALGDASEKGDLPKGASLTEVLDGLAHGPQYSPIFDCRKGGGAPVHRQIRWSYLDGDCRTLVMTVTDVSDLKDIEHRAYHDPLTGVLNMRGGERRAAEEFGKFLKGAACSVVMFDINDFGEFNNEYGHKKGDKVLRAFSKRMQKVNGGRCVLIRRGGDEFAMLVPGVGEEGAESLRRDILKRASELSVKCGGEKKSIYICAGIDWFVPGDGDSPSEKKAVKSFEKALKRADGSLYTAKDKKNKDKKKKGTCGNYVCYRGSGKVGHGETMERLARAVFEGYKRTLEREHKPIEYETFESQPKDFKNSDRAQAVDIRRKIESIGYKAVPVNADNKGRAIAELTPEEVEIIARLEHERWWAERKAAGWRYGEEKVVEKKTSPYMVPYDELPEDMKEYDRDSARNVINLLEQAGLVVLRNKKK